MLGDWRRQVDLGSEERWCGRVDFVRDDLALVVEVQSERYHSALTDQAHDAARRANLDAAGFTVVEVWDVQLWHAKHVVIAAVREGIRDARFLQLNRVPGHPIQLQETPEGGAHVGLVDSRPR